MTNSTKNSVPPGLKAADLIGKEYQVAVDTVWRDGRQRHKTKYWSGNHPMSGLLLAICNCANMVREASYRGLIPEQATAEFGDQLSLMWIAAQHWTKDAVEGRLSMDFFDGPTEPSACPRCLTPADRGVDKCQENRFICRECNIVFDVYIGDGLNGSKEGS